MSPDGERIEQAERLVRIEEGIIRNVEGGRIRGAEITAMRSDLAVYFAETQKANEKVELRVRELEKDRVRDDERIKHLAKHLENTAGRIDNVSKRVNLLSGINGVASAFAGIIGWFR